MQRSPSNSEAVSGCRGDGRTVRPSTRLPAAYPQKTRPARHKTPISVHFSFAGRTCSPTGHSDVATLKPMTPLQPLTQASVKPPSPLLAHEQQPLKPTTPLQPKNASKTPISHPQRRCRFHLRLALREQRRRRFHARDFQCPRAMAGPGRATGGRPTLQTSSNQRDSNRLTRTPVTNVVNPSPNTTIFSEKAVGLTTFATTGQKSTQKTPWFDDVCNNTHQSTPNTQHARPP